MLKVAVILEEHRVGGPAHRIARVFKEWPASDVQLVVVIPSFNSERLGQLFERAGLAVDRVPLSVLSMKPLLLARYLVFFPFEFIRLVFYLRSGSFDLVHVAGGAWMFKSLWAAKLAGLPVILHLNDTAMPSTIRFILSKSRALIDGVIFASHASRKYYKPNISNVPMSIIPSCVSEELFMHSSASAERAMNSHSDVLTFGTVGNVSPVKGHDRLIEAVAIAAGEGVLLRVRIAGAIDGTYGPYFEKLRQLAVSLNVSEQIEWLGSVSEVQVFLDSLDLFVCSSRNESSPMAVWEAMSRGLRIVSFDVGDAALHVEEAKAGCIVREQSSEALARGMLKARGGIGDSNPAAISEYTRSRFSARAVAEQTIGFYREVLNV